MASVKERINGNGEFTFKTDFLGLIRSNDPWHSHRPNAVVPYPCANTSTTGWNVYENKERFLNPSNTIRTAPTRTKFQQNQQAAQRSNLRPHAWPIHLTRVNKKYRTKSCSTTLPLRPWVVRLTSLAKPCYQRFQRIC